MNPARRTYLDWNATAPLRPEARQAMVAAIDLVGNPSSVHAEGRRGRSLVEAARDEVAALVGARPGEVIFTSGATEANAWVLRQGWDRVAHAPIEHASVTEPASRHGARVLELPVAADGVVSVEAVADSLARGDMAAGRSIIALQAANNETGVVQPVAEVAELARSNGLDMLIDAVQAAGRMPVDFARIGSSYLTISAHKLGGPMGVGALVVREGARLDPLLAGGGQERSRRAGTENVAAIAGFGAAAAVLRRVGAAEAGRMLVLRDRLEAGLLAASPQACVIGGTASRLPNTTCVALPGRQAAVLVAALDLAGIGVSAGAACSSGKVGASRTLAAMRLPLDIAAGAIRVSLGSMTTEVDIAAFLAAWRDVSAERRRAA